MLYEYDIAKHGDVIDVWSCVCISMVMKIFCELMIAIAL